MGFPEGSVVKESAAMQETLVQFPGQEDPLEKGTANPLQYSGLENPRERGSLVRVDLGSEHPLGSSLIG